MRVCCRIHCLHVSACRSYDAATTTTTTMAMYLCTKSSSSSISSCIFRESSVRSSVCVCVCVSVVGQWVNVCVCVCKWSEVSEWLPSKLYLYAIHRWTNQMCNRNRVKWIIWMCARALTHTRKSSNNWTPIEYVHLFSHTNYIERNASVEETKSFLAD